MAKDMTALTPRQKDALSFISGFIDGNGYAPTDSEITRGMGLGSTKSAHLHTNALIDKGYLTRTEGKRRSLKLTDMGMAAAYPGGNAPI